MKLVFSEYAPYLPGKENMNVSLIHSFTIKSVTSLNSANYFFRIFNHLFTSLTNSAYNSNFIKNQFSQVVVYLRIWVSLLTLLFISNIPSIFKVPVLLTS